MAENLDLLDVTIINRIIADITYGERERKQRQQFDAYRVFRGDVAHFVQEELQRTRPKSWKQYTLSDISISNMVTKKRATAYNEDPIRNIEGSEDRTENYDQIIKSTMGNRFFKEFDEVFNLQREALMWVNYRKEEAEWQFMALAPYEYSLVRNKDTGKVQVVVLHYPSNRIVSGTSQGDGKSDLIAESQDDGSAESDTYAMWTDTQHVVVRVRREKFTDSAGKQQIKIDITYVPLEDNPSNQNPLGVLPFAYLSSDMSPDNPYVNPLTEQTITFNALWSELLTAANIQGTGQFVLKYPEKYQGSIDSLAHGITTALELPQSGNPDDAATDASYINPNPDLAGQKESYMSYLKQVLAQHGITSSQGVSGNNESFSSGLERMIANADIQQIRTQNQSLYSEVESSVFKIVKAWDALIARAGGKRLFQDDDELMVTYPKPRILVSDTETLANIKQLLEMGLMEKWEALMKLDPNLTQEQAMQKIEKIEESRTQKVGSFLIGRQDNQDIEVRPEESESEG